MRRVWERGGAARGDTALLGAFGDHEGENGAARCPTALAIIDDKA